MDAEKSRELRTQYLKTLLGLQSPTELGLLRQEMVAAALLSQTSVNSHPSLASSLQDGKRLSALTISVKHQQKETLASPDKAAKQKTGDNDIHCLSILPTRMKSALTRPSDSYFIYRPVSVDEDYYTLPIRPKMSQSVQYWTDINTYNSYEESCDTSNHSYQTRRTATTADESSWLTRRISHDSQFPSEYEATEYKGAINGEQGDGDTAFDEQAIDTREDWDGMFHRLVRFNQRFGHSRISQRDKNYAKLGRWLHRQRHVALSDDYPDRKIRCRQKRQERREKLERLGVTFGKDDKSVDQRWVARVSELKRFHRLHGHACVLENHPKYRKLARWLNIQRSIALSATHPQRIQCRDVRAMRKGELEKLGVCFQD